MKKTAVGRGLFTGLTAPKPSLELMLGLRPNIAPQLQSHTPDQEVFRRDGSVNASAIPTRRARIDRLPVPQTPRRFPL
jgi:hypothetical protein